MPICNSKPSAVTPYGGIITPALLISRSMAAQPDRICAAAARTDRNEARSSGTTRTTDPGDRVVGLGLVPAAEEQPRAPLREYPRRLDADAGVAPGDHRRAPGLIRDIRLGPRGRRVAHLGLLAHLASAFPLATPASVR